MIPDRGRWAYDAFAYLNRIHFADRLPWPEIVWEPSAEGPWLGWCNPVRPDTLVIHLHPGLLGSVEKPNPWGVPDEWLGPRWAFDVLLHEATHVSVARLCPGQHRGSSPHDNRYWIAEVNRLAPALGFPDLVATRERPRLRDRLRRGLPQATVPFREVELFPYGYRKFAGTAESYYTDPAPPFER